MYNFDYDFGEAMRFLEETKNVHKVALDILKKRGRRITEYEQS